MPRRLIFLVFALLLSGGVVLLAQQWLHGQRGVPMQSATPEQPRTQVLVAKGDFPAGAFLRADSLAWQDWPDGAVSPAYIVQDKGRLEDFVGAVVRSGIVNGEPITAARVAQPGERGFMAAVLAPGHRAVTVNVTPATGMGGFVFPGDHVDLILTMTVQSADKNGPSRHLSETVLRDIRVVAMDQHAADDKKDVIVPKTATLEVTPKQAEIVSVVSELGLVSLSLRSLALPGDAIEDVISKTWDSDAIHVLQPENASTGGRKIAVIRGTTTTEVELPSAGARNGPQP